MEVQSLRSQRIDGLPKLDSASIKAFIDEPNEEVIQTIQEIVEGSTITALQPDRVPQTILELTEIRGLGAKLAKRVFDELGVADLEGLKAAAENGNLDSVKEVLSTNPKLSDQSHPMSKRKPLHYATRAGHAEIVHELLTSGADPFGGVHAYGPDTKPLNLASDRGHQNVVTAIEQKRSKSCLQTEPTKSPICVKPQPTVMSPQFSKSSTNNPT